MKSTVNCHLYSSWCNWFNQNQWWILSKDIQWCYLTEKMSNELPRGNILCKCVCVIVSFSYLHKNEEEAKSVVGLVVVLVLACYQKSALILRKSIVCQERYVSCLQHFSVCFCKSGEKKSFAVEKQSWPFFRGWMAMQCFRPPSLHVIFELCEVSHHSRVIYCACTFMWQKQSQSQLEVCKVLNILAAGRLTYWRQVV